MGQGHAIPTLLLPFVCKDLSLRQSVKKEHMGKRGRRKILHHISTIISEGSNVCALQSPHHYILITAGRSWVYNTKKYLFLISQMCDTHHIPSQNLFFPRKPQQIPAVCFETSSK